MCECMLFSLQVMNNYDGNLRTRFDVQEASQVMR